tara:strand:- start:179 stop:859 length:681 start_codon:yes stop_codon:yes gene_type:complete
LSIENKYYYKIVSECPKNGIIIDTNEKIDYSMVKRFSELNNLLKLIYECSEKYQKSIREVLIESKSRKIIFKKNSFQKSVKAIKKEIKKTNFNLCVDFNYFTHYILENVRLELMKNSNKKIPNRFESSYFFESISDCKRYLKNLDKTFSSSFFATNQLKVIKVKFIETKVLRKFDNILLTEFQDHYQSKDFNIIIKKYLKEGTSENPLFEYVFQGFYKVLKNDIRI